MGSSSRTSGLDARVSRSSYLLSDLLEVTALRVPDRPAVRCVGQELTFAELDNRVGKLAAALVANGVEPGDRVGVHLHMSVETMIAVHGILRAGAAFVPLDAVSPVSVLARIVDDCGIAAIVTNNNRGSSITELTMACPGLALIVGLDITDSQQAVPVDDVAIETFLSWSDIDEYAPIRRVPVLADDLAYVMYTSGSTGEPKGIMHTHRSGLSYTQLSADLYQVTEEDRLANFAPLHFDISTFAFFAGPATGACAVLISEPYLKMPASLCSLLVDEKCTILYTVPSMYMQMLGRGGAAGLDFGSVRWLKFGGEVLPPASAVELMAVFPNATFSNVYGPAEVNQCAFYNFDDPPSLDCEIPIGVAWGNTELRIVGPDGQLVEGSGEGWGGGSVRGELVVRTATMMQGYWNRPDLDAAVFDRTGSAGGRINHWFRTGDLVEASSDGVLTFLGRRDHQVKVRGHRLELESVESALGALPKVVHAVVGVRRSDAGQDELVASVVLEDDCQLDLGEFRRRLADRLAPYAIPTDIEQVDDFPRTPSGKIDRRTTRMSFNQQNFKQPLDQLGDTP